MKKNWLLLSVIFAVMFVLAACNNDGKDAAKTGDGNKEKSTQKETETNKEDTAKFPMDITNEGDAIKGGTLKVALVTDTPFKGVFIPELSDDAYDSTILDYAKNEIFELDGDFLVKDTGIAKLEVDKDNKKAKITIQGDVKWSDGKPLTAEDLIYPYEIIGHPDYDGKRYDDDFQNIIGAKEYHDGEAKTISGIKKIDEKSIEITFKKVSPAIYSVGDGLWGYAAPKHQLESIPVKDALIASDAVRKNPVTLGAFKIDKIVNGESVQLVANEHYFKGKPKLDKVVIEVVPSSSIGEALKTGKYDIAEHYPTNQYDSIKDLSNISIVSRPELSYSYVGFKVGKYDKANRMNIFDEKSKMNDVNLRRAIGYAMDIESVTEKFYQGLRVRANSLIPPVFASYYDGTLEGYHYDPEKAKELLDKAGYKDVDGDGIREGKDGKKFTIRLAAMSGSDTDEAIAEYYRQNWKEVGLNVELTTGRLIEFNSFYDKVEADDPEIDMYMAAWKTGTNPSPSGLYGEGAEFNLSRFVSAELTEMLEDIDSEKSMDPDHRAKAFRTWQEYMSKTATTMPMYFRTELFPVNKRVKNYNVDYANPTELQTIELTADAPLK
ncbi:oligopeptide ABC transporter substrate-binding protein [Lysinibacillus pakistanensis]|uniref:Oligopeptide ABC transporter substrate-binding protein n=1 Tax=Lysinibacillus pakistanensis TaxID=759811 RepID=A0AAX3WZB9_9BACI|nr:oligopeptide ABC transporter substrate-binding protein [Lysinibacillus pakistanensis]MDM5232160.1 oligopeptide ABC transporter substrate-binding protein [Lysinibacillus pakistanensis]WHY47683.1 oligopeptide ABC transporter substrate-binding protein [Lysinibacillus pakistanensis]WHY52694.1 oligopeptide ABC transporter substrate-binding protein [Lysinibacillus pakistanensis]